MTDEIKCETTTINVKLHSHQYQSMVKNDYRDAKKIVVFRRRRRRRSVTKELELLFENVA